MFSLILSLQYPSYLEQCALFAEVAFTGDSITHQEEVMS